MVRRLFYAWQSERPESVCRSFIRKALEATSAALKQFGVDERVEVDSDTQGVPGIPEILNTILLKIAEDDVFVADLTMCTASEGDGKLRRAPNANVMFEYGYALNAKGRERLICVMNVFFGGSDPSELPFDLRHARAPIRYKLSPDASPAEKEKVFNELCSRLMSAAKLIIDKLPSRVSDTPRVHFEKPHFSKGQELSPEGDFHQPSATIFDASHGFVYIKAHPTTEVLLSIAQLRKIQDPAAGLTISCGSGGGSTGTNKWGRVSFAVTRDAQTPEKRVSRDYVQYFREGDIEIINGSYLNVIEQRLLHVDFVIEQVITPMLGGAIAESW